MFESLNEFVLSAIVLLLGGFVAVLVGKWLGRRSPMIILLYFWHSFLGYFFSSYVLTNGGDAWDYYQQARFDYVEPSLGTEFIAWVTSIPVSLGFTYWPLAFFYNFLGAIGLIFFYVALEEVTANRASSAFTRVLVLVCVFIPSLSFWTAGIGKDSVAFLSVGMFLWSVLAFGKRQTGTVVAVLIMLCVRPHIAVLMVISVAIGTLLAKDLRTSVRFGMGAISAAAAVFAVPLALAYSGTLRFMTLAEFISDRQSQNLEGGSSVNISDMNPALRLTSFLYRPLPNEAAGFAQLAASFDNFLLVMLTFAGIVAIIRAGPMRVFRSQSIAALYALGCAILLSQVTANLGLAVRQKWMAVPALMLVIVAAWSAMKEKDAAPLRPRVQRLSGAPRAVR
jgi:hypothetical protein